MTSRGPLFRPSFTLLLLYLAGFFLFYALLFALPELLAGARELPPGTEPLTPEELARAKEISRRALGGGRTYLAFAAALVTIAIAAWRKVLPGLR